MKSILLSITFLLLFNASEAQTTEPTKDTTAKKDSAKIFHVVDQVPDFPGGVEKLYWFVTKNLKYPKKAKQDGTEGRVFVSFVVEKDGTLTNFEIVKSVSPECDAEAIRLMSTSPKWIPGMQAGRPVRVKFSLPVTFSLSN